MNYNQGGQPAAESQQIHVRSESSQLESSDETVAKSGEVLQSNNYNYWTEFALIVSII